MAVLSRCSNDHQMALLSQCTNYHYTTASVWKWSLEGSLDSECVYLLRTFDCKKKTSTSPNRRERLLFRKTRWGTTERESHTDEQKEGGRMQCFMKKEDESLVDVETVETTGERCCHLSWRTPLNGSLYIVRSSEWSASSTFMYIIPMYLRLTAFTKTLLQMSFHLYFFPNFYFALGLHPWLCSIEDQIFLRILKKILKFW